MGGGAKSEGIEGLIDKVDFGKMNGLVPVVVQDFDTGEVLMQAFMDREALRLTLETRLMHYWSRTKGRIWMKGEESGHTQSVVSARLDCDGDAILFSVRQRGVCCHTGEGSCFHRALVEGPTGGSARILGEVFQVIKGRMEAPRAGSYVSGLVSKGEDSILKKIGEEAAELMISAKGGDGIVHEAADLLFHLMILLAFKGIGLESVYAELERRRKGRGG
ncbi:MAG: bifunctional phosphoribosyl-AMP cyclohydrolase/phosphoribosyl-ATP diphosphatase HisIE [Candidatus Bathyarchaeia archaeon]